MNKLGLVVMALAASHVASADTARAPASGIEVRLSSVTLADNCNTPVKPGVPKTKFAKPPATPAAPATRDDVAPSDAPAQITKPGAPGVAPRGRFGCQQTSMQLQIASTSAKSTPIRIKRVELLDEKGKLVEVLAAREPTRWTDSGYALWDQTVGANETLEASYSLTAPSWHKMSNGRGRDRLYQLRVVVSAGGKTQRIDLQSISPVNMREPAVPT